MHDLPGKAAIPHPAFRKNLRKLEDFSNFQEGWMGAGSFPLDLKVKEFITSVLENSREGLPDVAMAPLPEGGIRFEFEKNGDFNIAEVTESLDLYLCVMSEYPEDPNYEGEVFECDRYFELADQQILLNFIQDGIFP
jgi:hypothetical protein